MEIFGRREFNYKNEENKETDTETSQSSQMFPTTRTEQNARNIPTTDTSWSAYFKTMLRDSLFYTWCCGVAMYAHLSLGMFPVMSQYLQSEKHVLRSVPLFSLIWLSNAIALLLYSPRILHKLCWSVTKFYAKHFRREFKNEQDFELDDVNEGETTSVEMVEQQERKTSMVNANASETQPDQSTETIVETIEDDHGAEDPSHISEAISERGTLTKVTNIDIEEHEKQKEKKPKLSKVASGDSVESNESADSTTQMLRGPIKFDRPSGFSKRLDPIEERIQASKTARMLINPWFDWFSMVWNNAKYLMLSWTLYAFTIVFVSRTFTNFLSSKLTLATYSQLIGLLAPFVISFLNTFIMRREKFSIVPVVLMLMSTVGGVLTLLGIASKQRTSDTFQWLPDLSDLEFTYNDLTGCIVALVTTLFLSLQIVFQDSLTSRDQQTNMQSIGVENLFIFQKFLLFGAALVPSVLFEDWTALQLLPWNDWLFLVGFSVFVILLGDIAALYAINKLGSTVFGVGLPLRLVSTMVGMFFVLGYMNTNLFEIAGSSVVIYAVGTLMVWKLLKDAWAQRKAFRMQKLEKTLVRDEEGKQHVETRQKQISIS